MQQEALPVCDECGQVVWYAEGLRICSICGNKFKGLKAVSGETPACCRCVTTFKLLNQWHPVKIPPKFPYSRWEGHSPEKKPEEISKGPNRCLRCGERYFTSRKCSCSNIGDYRGIKSTISIPDELREAIISYWEKKMGKKIGAFYGVLSEALQLWCSFFLEPNFLENYWKKNSINHS